jgi:hypothetical protein
MARTFTQNMQNIVGRYRESGRPWLATTEQMAAWAMDNHLWAPHRSRLIRLCADQIADAMREEYITDPQGRKVRAKHAARIKIGNKQQYLWDDIRTAGHEHMQVASQQRRQQIVGDCVQLKRDVDSYNQNRKPPIVSVKLTMPLCGPVHLRRRAMATFRMEGRVAHFTPHRATSDCDCCTAARVCIGGTSNPPY